MVLDHHLDDGEPSTVERSPDTRLLWWILGALGAAVVLGAIGALLRSDPSAPEPSETDRPARAEVAPPAGSVDAPPDPVAPQPTIEPAPPRRFLDSPGGIPGAEFPASVPPFEGPPGLVLVGHSDQGRLAAVRPDGTVTELMVGDGARFLPQAVNSTTLLGLMDLGGSTLTLDANGEVGTVLVDNHDAPIYLPSSGGQGYVVHGTWLGKVTYIDAQAVETARGPDLARGTVVIGDTDAGLVVMALDGAALLIDRSDGTVLRRLPSVPLTVGGSHQVVVACTTPNHCRTEIQTIGGETTGILDVDPHLAGRLVTAMSPDGRYVAYRFQQQLRVVDTAGAEVVRFRADDVQQVLWFADAVIVADRASVQLWMPGFDTPHGLDIGAAIHPSFRGIAVIEDSRHAD
jgi:hypothetical protein